MGPKIQRCVLRLVPVGPFSSAKHCYRVETTPTAIAVDIASQLSNCALQGLAKDSMGVVLKDRMGSIVTWDSAIRQAVYILFMVYIWTALCACTPQETSIQREDVVHVEGEFFWRAVTDERYDFTLDEPHAKEALSIIAEGNEVETLPWQGAAILVVHYKNGVSKKIQVTDSNVVMVDGKAYKTKGDELLQYIWKYMKKERKGNNS